MEKKSKLNKHDWDAKLANRFGLFQVEGIVLEVADEWEFQENAVKRKFR